MPVNQNDIICLPITDYDRRMGEYISQLVGPMQQNMGRGNQQVIQNTTEGEIAKRIMVRYLYDNQIVTLDWSSARPNIQYNNKPFDILINNYNIDFRASTLDIDIQTTLNSRNIIRPQNTNMQNTYIIIQSFYDDNSVYLFAWAYYDEFILHAQQRNVNVVGQSSCLPFNNQYARAIAELIANYNSGIL